ncbi:cisplatin damage response ATP-dependent DNA ligase [Methylocapsa acidiphila]|uniref:cisplatin damage response ATP-dependent DNA ligase n=1 Tax=Methylocapsa acidiphila TaxID=133552 RepID=UPI0003F67A20|nr:cisplatin damage response ATP-dependent DNA ligase [Methylocapsa acidiphila]
MNRFAQLLDRLGFEPSRTGKLRLMTEYFKTAPDPERGYALAALAGALSFQYAKPALIRGLIAKRVDPYLFALSYDYVGDLAETAALLWPAAPASADQSAPAHRLTGPPSLSEVVQSLATLGKADLPRQLAIWLDALDETGRWALLKLITGSLRVGVSSALAKASVAALGGQTGVAVEDLWHGLAPPYLDLFAWLEGRADRPAASNPAPFFPAMLAHAIEARDFETLDPAQFCAEWKWDGIRVQAVSGADSSGRNIARIYSRSGEDLSAAFPDLIECLAQSPAAGFALDGELLIRRGGKIEPFSILQQRLNRKTVSAKMLAEFPAHIRAYDLLWSETEDLRPLPFLERRARLEALVSARGEPRLDLSTLIPFASWPELAQARQDPLAYGAGADVGAVEGVMLKRAASGYLQGRPKGHWYKWKRDPWNVDAVLMYAQRGHGKRSSLYSDYTFGVWRSGSQGPELVPVGKAYFGFTDAELAKLDHFVRNNTTNRFGPVREIDHHPARGLVLEIAFEGLNRSSRHRSGLAMRFPRIARIRWDKPAAEADAIETLEALLTPKLGPG